MDTEKKQKKKYPQGQNRKTTILQDFLSAREDSSRKIYRKFKISPQEEGVKLLLVDGSFFYKKKDIDSMLKEFQQIFIKHPSK